MVFSIIPQNKQDFTERYLFIIIFIFGTIFIYLSKYFLGQFIASGIALLLITIYAFILYSAKSLRAGDNIYYLGFLFTLISLCFALYDFSISSGDALRHIISNFAVALSSTIWGLVLRVALSQQSIEQIEENTRLAMNEASKKLTVTLNTFILDFTNYSTTIQIAKMNIEESVKSIDQEMIQYANKLNTISDACIKTFEVSLQKLTEIDTPNEVFSKKMEPFFAELGTLFDDIKKNHRIENKTSQKTITQFQVLNKSMEGFSENIEIITKTVINFTTELNTVKSISKDMGILKEGIVRQLEEQNILNRDSILHQKNSTEELVKHSEQYEKHLKIVNTSIEEMNSLILSASKNLLNATKSMEEDVLQVRDKSIITQEKVNQGLEESLSATHKMNTVLGQMCDYITKSFKGKA